MFSVIVPTYNRVALLARTIDSVLRQTHADFELIVVSDGSTDGTDAYLSGLAAEGRIAYLSHPNQGLAATRKAGLARARGDLIAFTDDDCVLPVDWLERIGRHFADPAVVMVGGSTRTGNPGNVFALTNDCINNYFKGALAGRQGGSPYLTGNNIAYRRAALERAGGPDGEFRMGAEDRDLAHRVAQGGGRVVYDPALVVDHYNDADLRRFIRHQYHQGQGSRLYYAKSGRGGTTPDPIPPGVYLGLLGEPFRRYPFGTALVVVSLILLAQAAVVAGFLANREPGS